MEILHRKGTEVSPTILLDKKNGIFEISGRSLIEDSAAFYQPVLQWIKAYGMKPNATTDFIFKLEYFNTVSSKSFFDLLSVLEDINGAKIVWYFYDEDEDMEEAGQEFSELVKIPFEFKTY